MSKRLEIIWILDESCYSDATMILEILDYHYFYSAGKGIVL